MSSIPFTQSPHEPLVIMQGHSQAGRVYKHDGIRTEEETRAIANLWLASQDLYEALTDLFNNYRTLADSGDAGFWALEETEAGQKALAALAKARGEAQ
ncbi:hypothetical protein [Roseibium alexandrii]|uniref:hypothetical protein n=1 Tax=Roseibium alexandrii TaxID=388408 RepID=UPI00375277E3